jgi:DNA-directed RNA polymerase subunit RPC12/RpoP
VDQDRAERDKHLSDRLFDTISSNVPFIKSLSVSFIHIQPQLGTKCRLCGFRYAMRDRTSDLKHCRLRLKLACVGSYYADSPSSMTTAMSGTYKHEGSERKMDWIVWITYWIR